MKTNIILLGFLAVSGLALAAIMAAPPVVTPPPCCPTGTCLVKPVETTVVLDPVKFLVPGTTTKPTGAMVDPANDLTALLAQYEVQAKAVMSAKADLDTKATARAAAVVAEQTAEDVAHKAKNDIAVTIAAINAILFGIPAPTPPAVEVTPPPEPAPPQPVAVKPTVLIIETSGCSACTALEAFIKSRKASLEALYQIKYDSSSATAAKYGVRVCPTTILLKEDGTQWGDPFVGSDDMGWSQWLNNTSKKR